MLLFNAQKNMSNYFSLKNGCNYCCWRSYRRESRAGGRRKRIFSTRIILNARITHYQYCLPSHVIFNYLQKIKDDLEPSTRSHAITGLSKLLAKLHFLASVSFLTYCGIVIYLLFICDNANLCCAWYIALVDM